MPSKLPLNDEFGDIVLSQEAQLLLIELSSSFPVAVNLEPTGPSLEWGRKIFIEAVRDLCETGLLQYESCMLGVFPQPHYSGVVLTHRGFDLSRRLKSKPEDEADNSNQPDRLGSAFDYFTGQLCH